MFYFSSHSLCSFAIFSFYYVKVEGGGVKAPQPHPLRGPCITLHSVHGELSRVCQTKCLYEKKLTSPPGVTLPSKRMTPHPGLPGPPSQLCVFSCKRFAAFYKEMYEKFYRLGWFGLEGNPPTRDNSFPYKQALRWPPLYFVHMVWVLAVFQSFYCN